MAGIKVPQYDIFKIGTDKLKYSNWNLNISKKDAFKYQELVPLFEGQHFRIMANKILNENIKDIDAKIQKLNDELTAGADAKRAVEINKEIARLNNEKLINEIRLNVNDGKNKALNTIEKEIVETSIKAFKLFNLTGVTRFDYLVDKKTKQVYLNEPNTIPGCLAFFFFKAKGKSYTELLDDMIATAIKDYKSEQKRITNFESNILATYNGSKGNKNKLN